jgi:hypothetical protein
MQAVGGSGATEYSRANSTVSDIVSVAVTRQGCCSPGTDSVFSASVFEAFLRGNALMLTNGSLNRDPICGATHVLVVKSP